MFWSTLQLWGRNGSPPRASRWLGTCFIHRNWHPQADHHQGHPDDWAPALFTGTGTHRRITAKGIQMIGHLLYSPELAPTGFFLFPMVKKELAGLSLTQETFKKSWEGVVRLRQRGLCHHLQSMDWALQNCVCIVNDYVKKSLEKNSNLISTVFSFFSN